MVCVALTIFHEGFLIYSNTVFILTRILEKVQKKTTTTTKIIIWAILISVRAVNQLKLIWAAALATNLDSSPLFLAVSAAAQLCLTSSGVLVAQVKIPIKSSGFGGIVLDLHQGTHEQNLTVGFLRVPAAWAAFPWHKQWQSTQEDWQVAEIFYLYSASSPRLRCFYFTTVLKQRLMRL